MGVVPAERMGAPAPASEEEEKEDEEQNEGSNQEAVGTPNTMYQWGVCLNLGFTNRDWYELYWESTKLQLEKQKENNLNLQQDLQYSFIYNIVIYNIVIYGLHSVNVLFELILLLTKSRSLQHYYSQEYSLLLINEFDEIYKYYKA